MSAVLKAIAAALVLALSAGTASAGSYSLVEWSDLKPEIFGDRALLSGEGHVTLEAPYRATNDARVPVEIAATAPGLSPIRKVTLVIDQNPMPVSAIFDLDQPRRSVRFGLDLRLNGPSMVRAVVETDDGQLYMTANLVKTSGQGACAAPPMGDPEEAIAAIGQMQVTAAPAAEGRSAVRTARLDMRHPQHTGMQMDQITLHYILARFVDTVDVWAGEEKLFTLTGSISLSEDPGFSFEIMDPEARSVRVRLTDTDGMVVERELPLSPES